MQFPDSEFWNFSIGFYANPEVESTCLNLQDQYHLNVNLILFCYWLAENKQEPLDKEQWTQLLSAAQPWEEIIKPLRQSRKMISHSSIAWPSDFKIETGKHVSNIEINTEHMQQLSIEQAWRQMNCIECDKSHLDIINNNLNAYLISKNSEFTVDSISNETDTLLNTFLDYQENKKTIAL